SGIFCCDTLLVSRSFVIFRKNLLVCLALRVGMSTAANNHDYGEHIGLIKHESIEDEHMWQTTICIFI
ncbi:hypothetical protein ACJX0J_018366, partial [Zea mays]